MLLDLFKSYTITVCITEADFNQFQELAENAKREYENRIAKQQSYIEDLKSQVNQLTDVCNRQRADILLDIDDQLEEIYNEGILNERSVARLRSMMDELRGKTRR